MKQIILLFTLVVCCDFVIAQDLSFYTKPILGAKVFNKPIIFPDANINFDGIICRKPLLGHADRPLYVVDGILVDEAAVKKLDPENIESISLLNTKDFAKIISCRLPKAVIVIVTKTADQRTIIIKDMFNEEALPGASVEIISIGRAKNNLHLIADSFGRVVTNKIDPGSEYEIRVSNVGYRSYIASLNAATIGKNYSVVLERDYLQAAEAVVVSGTVCIVRRMINFTCGPTSKDSVIKIPSKITRLATSQKDITIYPNPVLRSQNIHIEFENKNDSKVTMRVFSLDNKLINAREYNVNEGMNRISHLIDARLAPGVYIVQVINVTDRFIRSGKIIVQ